MMCVCVYTKNGIYVCERKRNIQGKRERKRESYL